MDWQRRFEPLNELLILESKFYVYKYSRAVIEMSNLMGMAE